MRRNFTPTPPTSSYQRFAPSNPALCSIRSLPNRQAQRAHFQRAWSILPSVLLTVMVGWTGEVQAQSSIPPAPHQNAASADLSNFSTPALSTLPNLTAQTPTVPPAPAELQQILRGVDAGANDRNLDAVMEFYSPQFKSADGLTFETMQTALKQFWQQYSDLNYKTELNTWRRQGRAIVAETTTTITGSYENKGRKLMLSATLKSRQRLEAGKILSQEILSERSQISTGSQPPTLQIALPQQVAAGNAFDFDAIVMEPLGDRLLLGAALEEPIQPNNYLNAAPITLELLSSGGLFKTGRAPANPENRWVSAIIVRDDGITAVTQRLRITPAAGNARR